MDVYEAIARRKTIRDFEDKPVPVEIIKKIIDAGLKAPSNDHLRRWEFIVVQDRARREEMVCYFGAPRTEEGAIAVIDAWGMTDPVQRAMYIDGIPKQHSMILNAGCVIIPCFYASGPLLAPTSLPCLNEFASIWCCVENMLIAAAGEGIFGVTRIPFDEERARLKTFLHIPECYEVPCYVALGYPKPDAKRARQLEIDLDTKIHMNGW